MCVWVPQDSAQTCQDILFLSYFQKKEVGRLFLAVVRDSGMSNCIKNGCSGRMCWGCGCSQHGRVRCLPQPPPSNSDAGKKSVLPKGNSVFPSIPVCPALPTSSPSTHFLFSHSFHLLAAVGPVLARCEMQL